MIGKSLIAAAGNGISTGDVAEAIDFDGTNDYLRRTSDLTGNTTSKTFTFSTWIWQGGSGTSWIYVNSTGVSQRFTVRVVSGTVEVVGTANTGTEILRITAPLVAVSRTATFYHVLISIDLANAANRSIYINDVAQTLNATVYTNAAIPFNQIDHVIAGTEGGSAGDLGRLSNVFLDYTYRDLSVTANRRLFITADLKPAAGQAALNPILYLPMDDPTAPGANAGTGGNFTLTGTVARSGRGPNQYNAPMSYYNGSSSLYKTGAIASNGKQVTIAFNLRSVSGSGIFCSGNSQLRFFVYSNSGAIVFQGKNSAGTLILIATAAMPTSTLMTNRNVNVVFSCDMSDTAKRHVYINGVAASVTWSTYTNDAFELSRTETIVGLTNGSSPDYMTGYLGALWFHPTYIDLSAASNLAKFVIGTDIDAKPVDLGASGELPTGTSPIIYLPMYGNNPGKNYGTAGNFSPSPTTMTGARGPNEYWGNKADFDGTTGFLSKATTLGGVTSGKTMSGSFWINPDVVTGAPILLSMGTSAPATIVDISVDGSSRLQFRLYDLGTTKLSATVTSVTLGAGTSYFVQFCVDLSDSGKRFVYINGVAATVSYGFYVDASIPFSSINLAKFGQNFANSNNTYNGKLSEFYLTTEYIDFSQEANRLKFRDAFGNPVDLTQQIEDAAIPNPAIYMRFPPTSFGTNSGTGGNFTVNGTISDGGQL